MWLAIKTSSAKEEELRAVSTRQGMEAAAVCSPYGIYARPMQDEEILLWSVGENKVCLGAVQERQPELQEGEILLRSAGGASIRLCADGKILLNGKVFE